MTPVATLRATQCGCARRTTVARVGGEEFCVIRPPQDAQVTAGASSEVTGTPAAPATADRPA